MTHSIFALAILAIAASASAGDCCQTCACNQCGCQAQCRKSCRLVCEMKDVKRVCYSCKCEDFCVPGPSCRCGEVCECDPCSSACGCKCLGCLFGDGKVCRTIWKPSCEARMFTRNKLYKYEISKKVPTYKWVVEYHCDACQSATPCSEAAPPVPAALLNSAGYEASPAANSPITAPAELDMPLAAGTVDTHAVQQAAAWFEAK